ncbi:MAG: hypothetical protein ACJZ37_00750 [Candidatus Poseidoniales archaeon]|nr:hypothetical protein [Marine Group III euryarchaeote]
MSLDDSSKLDLNDIDRVFALWVILVILWNYGYPNAEPIYDVLVAISLFFIVKFIRTNL